MGNARGMNLEHNLFWVTITAEEGIHRIRLYDVVISGRWSEILKLTYYDVVV
jgi:hypothetical protein